MTKLYYCNTHYNIKPPIDINPLILQRYKNNKVLVLCARDGMIKRISKYINSASFPYPSIQLLVCGWWQLAETGLLLGNQINYHRLSLQNAVVILNKARIHNKYEGFVHQIEEFFQCDMLLPTG